MDERFALGDFYIHASRKSFRGRQRFIVLGPRLPGESYRPLVAAGDFTYDNKLDLDHGSLDPELGMRLEQRLAEVFE